MEHISNFKLLLFTYFFCKNVLKYKNVIYHETQFLQNTSKHKGSLTGAVICISVRFAPPACASSLTTNPFIVEQSNRI